MTKWIQTPKIVKEGYCMTKVNSLPPSGFSVLLAMAFRWSSTLVWKQFFFSQIFLFKKRDKLIFKSTRLLYLTPIHGQSSEVKVDYEFTP